MYSNDLICDIIEYINKNIKSKISIETISNTFSYDRFYIMKKFKKELNISIVAFINHKRIYESLSYLKNNNQTILYIALINGFYSLEYYSEIFKKVIGVSPKKYQNNITRKKEFTEKEERLVLEKTVKLQEIIQKEKNYLQRRKPQEVKELTLSLFKQ